MNAASTDNLFRKRAIEALREKQPGRPICLVPRPWLWLNGLLVVLFLSGGAFLCTAEFSRNEAARGWLVAKPGVVRIAYDASTIVRNILASPGDSVAPGDPLIYLSTDSGLVGGGSKNEYVLEKIRDEIREIDQQIYLSHEQQELEVETLSMQLLGYDAELTSLQARLARQARQVALSRDKAARLDSGRVSGAVTDWEVLLQREDQGFREQELVRLQQSLAAKNRERESLRARLANVPYKAGAARSALRTAHAQLAQQIAEFESRRLTVLNAPIAGAVASVEVGVGTLLSPRQLIMTLLPADMVLAAEIYVPSRAAGFIRPGQTVQLALDAFPPQKFGTFEGTVERVSDIVLLPAEIPQTFPLVEAAYKVRVSLRDPQTGNRIGGMRLRPGMLLNARIVLESRNLVDWLLEPLQLQRSNSA